MARSSPMILVLGRARAGQRDFGAAHAAIASGTRRSAGGLQLPAPMLRPSPRPAGAAVVSPLPLIRAGVLASSVRWLCAAGIMIAAVALREVNIARAYDVHVDELTYSNISLNLAVRHSLRYFNQPFFVHPPGFLFIEAAYIKLAHLTHRSPLGVVYGVRNLMAVLAGISTGLVFAVTWLGTRRLAAALVAGALFCLDPFVVRISSLGLLESPAVLFALAGYTALIPLAGADRGRKASLLTIAAGVAFGVALLTKETAFFLTIVPLLICLAGGWCFRRAVSIRIAAIATLVYLPYPVITAATGYWHDYRAQTVQGLLRFLGNIQNTGYNQRNGPSLPAAVQTQLSSYATSYILIATGFVAAIYLFRRGDARQRVVALMTISSYAYIVYSIARGTIEEQFFYLVTVPSIICSVAGFALFWRERASNSVAVARLAAVGLVGIFAWNAYTYVNVHTTADNGYQRVAAYLDRCAAPGAPIAATTQTAAILFGTNHPTVSWASLNHLRQGNGTLVFVSSKIVAQHYQPVTTTEYRRLQSVARRVYVVSGRSFGRLEVYDLRGLDAQKPLLRPACES